MSLKTLYSQFASNQLQISFVILVQKVHKHAGKIIDVTKSNEVLTLAHAFLST